ncbi:MAG: RHS repeat-associated core domain-containing protein [Deltaproteobacteria bacterium]|nr:RHS repeat-associated core domain-containing protein [Deltaproteobacteria bacterium]
MRSTRRKRLPVRRRSSGRVLYNWHRFYDPSIGRYISADPIGQRGGVNLYSYVANNPISLIDQAGLRLEFLTDGSKAAVNEARAYYAGNGIDDPFAALEASGDVFYISTNSSMNNGYRENHIFWDPGAALGPLICSESGGEYQSPAMGLLHEGEHARNDMNGSYAGSKRRPHAGGAFPDEEEWAVTTGPEATAAAKAGEPGRDFYEGEYAPVSCVTCRRPFMSEMR